MLPLETSAPDFTLPDTEGRNVSRSDFDGRPMLVIFMCNHCPYVKHVADGLKAIGDDYSDTDLGIVAISSNDIDAHPDDSPEAMKRERESRGYAFAYLFDEDQSVAKAYRAACTPDFFLFDNDHKLFYRGQMDSSRPKTESPTPVTGEDLRAAIDAVLAGDPPPQNQVPSLGCNIKWKPGNGPEYFAG